MYAKELRRTELKVTPNCRKRDTAVIYDANLIGKTVPRNSAKIGNDRCNVFDIMSRGILEESLLQICRSHLFHCLNTTLSTPNLYNPKLPNCLRSRAFTSYHQDGNGPYRVGYKRVCQEILVLRKMGSC